MQFHVKFWEQNIGNKLNRLTEIKGNRVFWTMQFLNRMTECSFKCVVLKIKPRAKVIMLNLANFLI